MVTDRPTSAQAHEADRLAAATRPDRVFAGHRRLFGLTWAHLLNDGAANYLPGVLPAVLVSLDEPVQMAGVLIAVLTVGQALQPVTGWIADRVGGRSLVVSGLLLTSLAGGLVGLAPGTAILIVLLLLVGIGNAFFHPQALAGVRSLLRGRRGLWTSVFLVGGELGRGLWPTVASLVTEQLGLAYLGLIALPGLVTIPILWRSAPRLVAAPRRGRAIRWRAHAHPMALLIAYRSMQSFAIYGLVTYIPIMWHIRGGSLVEGASVITTMVTVGVVGNLWGGHLADRFGRRPVLLASALGACVFVFPVLYLNGAWIWIAAAALGIALFLTASTAVLIGQDIFPENRSMGSGIALGLANGIGALLVLVLGLWVDNTNVVWVFWVLAALGVASAIVALAFPSRYLDGNAS